MSVFGWGRSLVERGVGAVNGAAARVVNSLPVRASTALLVYSGKTIYYGLRQLLTLPAAAYQLYSDEKSWKSTRNMLYVASWEVAPVLAGYLLLHQLDSRENREKQVSLELSWPFLLTASTMLLRTGLSLVNYYQTPRLYLRTTLTSLEANQAVVTRKPKEQPERCKKAECSAVDRIKGSGFEFAELVANEMLISALGWVGNNGRDLPWLRYLAVFLYYVEPLLRAYARGRYIYKVTTPEACREHRSIESEQALAIGVVNVLAMNYLESGLKSIGAPWIAGNFFKQYLLLLQVAAAVDYTSSEMTKVSSFPDPLALYEGVVAWSLRASVTVVKEHVVPLFQGEPGQFPWQRILEIANQIYRNQVTQKATYYMLPDVVNAPLTFFEKDPICSPIYEAKRKALYAVVAGIVNFQTQYPRLTKIAKKKRGTASYLLSCYFDLSQESIKMALENLGKEKVDQLLREIKLWLERHQGLSPDEVIKLDDIQFLGQLNPPREGGEMEIIVLDEAPPVDALQEKTRQEVLSRDVALYFGRGAQKQASETLNTIPPPLTKEPNIEGRSSAARDKALFFGEKGARVLPPSNQLVAARRLSINRDKDVFFGDSFGRKKKVDDGGSALNLNLD